MLVCPNSCNVRLILINIDRGALYPPWQIDVSSDAFRRPQLYGLSSLDEDLKDKLRSEAG